MTARFNVWFDEGAGREAWLDALRRWPGSEVYAHPDYLSLFARSGGRPVCLHFQDDRGEALYPLILRELAELPFAKDAAGYDVITAPFGYGGPFVRTGGDATPLVEAFFAEYVRWAREFSVVSEYTTFSPVTSFAGVYPGSVTERMPVVVRRLDVDEDALFSSYKESLRRAVRRAQKLGVVVEVDAEGTELAAFLDIYAHTSARRGGFASSYELTEPFLVDFRRLLGAHARFFHARHEGVIVSTEMVLLSGDAMVFFRGGTMTDKLNTRANQLLKHEICVWGMRAGLRQYLLGGGNTSDPEDPLFVYKRTFAPDGVRMLQVGRWVMDTVRYGQLVEARRRYEEQAGRTFRPAPQYFPVYRAPMAEGKASTT